MLTKEEDSIVIAWTLTMQECKLSISLQQLKMKGCKVDQKRVTQFQDGIHATIVVLVQA